MEHPAPTHTRTPARGRNVSRFLPLLVMVLIGFLILKDQVPAVNRWFQSIVAPERYAAAEACRRAALNAATQPDYARVRDEGTVHETQNGFYVEGVSIGEMGEDGAETVYRFNCYADSFGKVVKTNKEAPASHP